MLRAIRLLTNKIHPVEILFNLVKRHSQRHGRLDCFGTLQKGVRMLQQQFGNFMCHVWPRRPQPPRLLGSISKWDHHNYSPHSPKRDFSTRLMAPTSRRPRSPWYRHSLPLESGRLRSDELLVYSISSLKLNPRRSRLAGILTTCCANVDDRWLANLDNNANNSENSRRLLWEQPAISVPPSDRIPFCENPLAVGEQGRKAPFAFVAGAKQRTGRSLVTCSCPHGYSSSRG